MRYVKFHSNDNNATYIVQYYYDSCFSVSFHSDEIFFFFLLPFLLLLLTDPPGELVLPQLLQRAQAEEGSGGAFGAGRCHIGVRGFGV